MLLTNQPTNRHGWKQPPMVEVMKMILHKYMVIFAGVCTKQAHSFNNQRLWFVGQRISAAPQSLICNGMLWHILPCSSRDLDVPLGHIHLGGRLQVLSAAGIIFLSDKINQSQNGLIQIVHRRQSRTTAGMRFVILSSRQHGRHG